MSAFRLGLTGSIGMGKSTAAKMFADAGCDVWDADAAVHRLYAPGGAAVAPLAALHPEAVVDGAVSRPALKAWIDADPTALARIEKVVHPLVAADRAAFAARSSAPVTVYDIPLLFENGTQAQMDAVAVVSAPASVQRDRVLARGTMTEAQFEAILAKQMPDADKRARADYIIRSTSLAQAQEDVDRILQEIGHRHA
ncbi:dephospho-CoA kinase [Fluviibacterium sp. S390]|uniref:dephospho-CoA kinase n=1 Tax=Fluviibacterium sp. S390 TaxID=3415139 RepID=UPI003C7B125C